jgi:hypothetical protein
MWRGAWGSLLEDRPHNMFSQPPKISSALTMLSWFCFCFYCRSIDTSHYSQVGTSKGLNSWFGNFAQEEESFCELRNEISSYFAGRGWPRVKSWFENMNGMIIKGRNHMCTCGAYFQLVDTALLLTSVLKKHPSTMSDNPPKQQLLDDWLTCDYKPDWNITWLVPLEYSSGLARGRCSVAMGGVKVMLR